MMRMNSENKEVREDVKESKILHKLMRRATQKF
jgi:hypothetical protein